MTVIGEDTPQHRVVAVPEAGPKRDDEHAAAHYARLSAEHRPAPVSDRPDPRDRVNVVVEDDAHPRGRAAEHASVRGNGAEQPGMGQAGLGESQATEQGEEEEDPSRQRFKKTSRARC